MLHWLALMRILLDESTPRQLKLLLEGHEVRTVQEHGWAAMENGELLTLASKEFDVFLTPDRNLPHQQSLPDYDIAVVVLAAGPNRIATYEPIADVIRKALEEPRRER